MSNNLIPRDQRLPALGSSAPDAITLGHYVKEERNKPVVGREMRYGGALHTLVFGPNGSGKSTRLLLPNLLEMENRSIVVVDPKGELAAVSAPFRRTIGEVVIINPFGVLADRSGYADLKSDGFNPLLHLDPDSDTFNADAGLLAEALVKVEGKDPHWDASAQSLIAALIMFVCCEAKRIGDTPTLTEVRTLLCQNPYKNDRRDSEESENEFAGDTSRQGSWIPRLASEMMESHIPGLQNKASQFSVWTNEISSIVSAARRQTEPFDDTQIANDLARGTFDFREMKKRPVTVYLILPPRMIERHSKWLRLILTSALQSVLREREPGEPRILFMLDEFAALGHLKIIETVWALVRGYGIQIMPVLQDIHQLRGLYQERWETFIGMAGAVVAFGAREMTSAKWLSERAGETTRVAASYNSGGGVGQDTKHEGLAWQQIKVPFITPQKFFSMRDGFMFVWLARVSDTIAAYAPFYENIGKLKGKYRENPYRQHRT
jgi:type IV secretion system protein VirD4